MKALLKVYLYIIYVVALPVFLVFSLVLLVYNAIECIKDCGKWNVNEALKAYAEGCVMGHKINMARIEDIYSDDEGYHEEGV